MPGRVCPHCAAAIPADAPGQLCARCVLNAAATETDAGTTSARQAPPSLAEVAAAFPGFEVMGLAGVGGMGFVYRVRSRADGRESALKLLPAALAAEPAFVERFEREARTLARLQHPNIVAVHGFGRAGGFCYLLMEFVEGANLRQAMRSARFSPAETLALVPQLCDALQYAHSQGILHRDIKPENILLDARGVPKIADFGIAKLVGVHESPDQFTLTQTGQRVGTPHYMAPEQIERPGSVDHRADIYSLGVVLYELLTGELPLGRFPAPSVKAALDARIDEIVFRALSKERELRQQSARQVRHEVESLESTPAAPPKAPSAGVVDCQVTTPGHLRSWRGTFHAFPHDGSLRLESGQLVFTSPERSCTIPLAQVTGLSIGRLPWFLHPLIQYVAVRFVADGCESCILLAPHDPKLPLVQGEGLVEEWHRTIRDAMAAAGLAAVPAIEKEQLGQGTRQKLRSMAFALAPAVPALAVVAYVNHLTIPAIQGDGLKSAAITIGGGLVGVVMLFSFITLLAMGIRALRFRAPGRQRYPVLKSFLIWTVLPLVLWLLINLLLRPKPMSFEEFQTVSTNAHLRPLSDLIQGASNRMGMLPPSLRTSGETNSLESRTNWAYSPPPARSANGGRHGARATDAVQALANLFPLLQEASNRVGCLPPSLHTFGLAAAHPSSHRPFVYLGGNPKRQSPVLAFPQATPDAGPQDVLLFDGSVQPMSSNELALYLQTEFLWAQNQVRKLRDDGPLPLELDGSLSAWATQGVPLPPGMVLSPAAARALQGWGVTVVMDVSSPQACRVAHGSLAEVFWTATDEVSQNGKPALAVEALQPFLTFLAAPGTVPVRFEFMLAGHSHRVSREGVAAIAIVLAAHAGDPARLQLGRQLLDRFIAPDVDSARDVTLFERFKPGEERNQTEVVQIRLGELRMALPSHFLRPQLVRKGMENPEGGPPESVPTPWMPRR